MPDEAPDAVSTGRTGPRAVFAHPGMRSLFLWTFVARVVSNGGPTVITLYVVSSLRGNYSQAGWVNAAFTIGNALGAPVAGLLLGHGQRVRLVAVTMITEGAYWLVAGHLEVAPLAIASLVGGALVLPAYTFPRWAIATTLPSGPRSVAYALDAVCSKLGYTVGPPLAVLLASTVGTTTAFACLAALTLVAGFAYLLLRLATYAPDGAARVAAVPPTSSRPVAARSETNSALWVVGGTMLMVAATEVLLIALMRRHDQLKLLSVVIVTWSLASIAGGLLFSGRSRYATPHVLLAMMSLAVLPIGLAQSWWETALLIIPSGVLNSPTLATAAEWIGRRDGPGRGRLIGFQTSAISVGLSIGAPLGGWLADVASEAVSFGAVGAVGLVVAGISRYAVGLGRAPRAGEQALNDLTF